MENKIKSYVKENFSDLVALHKELCLIPAPSHKEERRAAFCEKWFKDIGFENAYTDSALNVVLPIDCEGKDKITVIVAHTDTVFPDMEPMEYRVENGRAYCPGSGDDTASVAVLMYAAKFIKEQNLRFKNGLMLVCNSAEEGLGNLKGTRQIFKDFEGRIERFISFDASVCNKIYDRCTGSCRFEVTAKTVGGHSFGNFGNPNAIHVLAQIINEIYKIEIPQKEGSKTTVNIGTISGGTSVNTIAQEAQMLCEFRSDNEAFLSLMKDNFYKIFENARKDDINVEVEVVGERPCEKGVDPKAKQQLVDTMANIIEPIFGKKCFTHSASTDCNIPLSLGIPAVAISVYEGAGTHTREEYIEIQSLEKGLEVGIKAAIEFLDK